ncbi:dTDP-4-dehydrorhamnose 3,5-epimerase family protein [Streptomyces sp. JJ38]|uniref:dTDP-4-dehydrorhamnose 3,5-epimerase family protein n=1 Tax=Streptomyces sp. JJ38 TaxID=2738128 RepID=UPI001C5912B5|nr:dTDP-4-dehydrorhamnose 3,5-epimerase family protein [Streptomyces sp. JJ38]MBW1596590.1 dTDP-4-dehydrorhamnose 3,5-epimerase family protein [Streptomyces sp. JJ38]
MRSRPLAVAGALEFTPEVFPDDRGRFTSTFQGEPFAAAHGAPLFAVAQASYSTSRRDVLRGVHYNARFPGVAKYVTCPAGSALDFLVDLRLGSPTFGRHDVVRLDAEHARALYVPPGVGHAFLAETDGTVMAYLLSAPYDPTDELALSPFDPALGLPLPSGPRPVLSPRDRAARTLAEARAADALPTYQPHHGS